MKSLRPNVVKQTAAERLEAAGLKNKILLFFCGIVLALCVVITGASYLLDHMMRNAGGLGGLGKRTMIETIQRLLPVVNIVAMLILELGLWNAMLRICRGQYASPQSLKMGLSRFFPWLRCTLLQTIIYTFIGIFLMNAAMVIFFILPISRNALELTVPLVTRYPDPVEMMDAMTADPELLMNLFRSIIPVYIIMAVLAFPVCMPVVYRLRLARLIILDDPTAGAFRALFGSFRMTKGYWRFFLKLDLSFWWYYLLLALSFAVNYADLLLAAVGQPLPISAAGASLFVYILSLASQLAIYYFLRPKVQVSTALIYDAILPKKEEPKNTVVLGNIFHI